MPGFNSVWRINMSILSPYMHWELFELFIKRWKINTRIIPWTLYKVQDSLFFGCGEVDVWFYQTWQWQQCWSVDQNFFWQISIPLTAELKFWIWLQFVRGFWEVIWKSFVPVTVSKVSHLHWHWYIFLWSLLIKNLGQQWYNNLQ